MYDKMKFDPTDYADPLFGVGSATSAGPTLPAGSIHPSPETLENDCGGYYREQPIVGFGHAYISGSGGTKCYGNYLLSPMVDGVEIDREKRASFAVEGTEIAKCYEYGVTLENGIRAKMTPAHNAAIHTFVYPAGKEASFLMDAAHKLDIDASMKKGYLTVDPANKIIYGGGLHFGNWSRIDWDMFFALEFDADFAEIGTMEGEELIPLAGGDVYTVEINEEKRLGAYVKFGTFAEEKTVKVKVAISFDSADRAKAFLAEQIPAFDYEAVKEAAKDKWRAAMGVIELNTSDEALLRRFYTAMYHMNIQPRNRLSDHGFWDDFHTLWDSWKTVFPMYCLLYPDKMGQIVDSFIDRAKKNETEGSGIVVGDEFLAAKEFAAGQGGNDIENAIVDA